MMCCELVSHPAMDMQIPRVLQAMDTGGKDGTIEHVCSGLNPQGVEVTSFKVPTPDELAHDFLWRVHKAVPARGMIGVFNRSHYEDVLVVRVHELAPKEIWSQRYEQINQFEKLLADTGTVVLKFFLHISKEEQKKTFARSPQHAGKAMEIRRGRPQRTRVVGKIHERVRGRVEQMLHRMGAVVRGTGQSQMVSKLCRSTCFMPNA